MWNAEFDCSLANRISSWFYLISSILLLITGFSCSGPEDSGQKAADESSEVLADATGESTQDLHDRLVHMLPGRWAIVSAEINYDFEDPKLATTQTYDPKSVDPASPKLPFPAEYSSDNTYVSLDTDPAQQEPLTEGHWDFRGDTLVLIQLKPETGRYLFKVSPEGEDRAVFSTVMDLDHDGQADDAYTGTLQKQTATTAQPQ